MIDLNGKVVVGAGAALMDLLLEEQDSFVAKMGSEKGGMTLVELDTIEKALKMSDTKPTIVPGGSACNTLVGISQLGGKSRMIGRLGNDDLGKQFLDGIKIAGVEHFVTMGSEPTGRVLAIVTPDAQRTMYTFLGASAGLTPGDIHADQFRDAGIVHLEGYMLFNRPVVDKILEFVKQTGARLCLDLASFQVVEATRDYLKEIIPHTSILIANEDEAKAFTNKEEAEALKEIASMVEIGVVKLGERGVLVSYGKQDWEVKGFPCEALDTTGAGDLWAAGFLHGICEGYTLEQAASMGCKVGSEVVQIMGAVIPPIGWERINTFCGTILKQGSEAAPQ